MQAKTFVYIVLFTLFTVHSSFGQNDKVVSVCDKVASAFEKSEITTLSKYMNNSITLDVGSAKGIYQKSQAIIILKGFMKGKTVKSFEQQPIDNDSFCCGILKTTTGNYLVYYKIRDFYGRSLIHDLKVTASN